MADRDTWIEVVFIILVINLIPLPLLEKSLTDQLKTFLFFSTEPYVLWNELKDEKDQCNNQTMTLNQP